MTVISKDWKSHSNTLVMLKLLQHIGNFRKKLVNIYLIGKIKDRIKDMHLFLLKPPGNKYIQINFVEYTQHPELIEVRRRIKVREEKIFFVTLRNEDLQRVLSKKDKKLSQPECQLSLIIRNPYLWAIQRR